MPPAQYIWPIGFLCSVWNSPPDSMRDPAVSRDRQLCVFTEDAFVCNTLMHTVHQSFYDDAVYKFTVHSTYLLRITRCSIAHYHALV